MEAKRVQDEPDGATYVSVDTETASYAPTAAWELGQRRMRMPEGATPKTPLWLLEDDSGEAELLCDIKEIIAWGQGRRNVSATLLHAAAH